MVIKFEPHVYRVGPNEGTADSDDELETPKTLRRYIEPWLSAVAQSEHLSLLLGSGFGISLAHAADATPARMEPGDWKGLPFGEKVEEHAKKVAEKCNRGAPNIEDQLRAAFQLRGGLEIMGDDRAVQWKQAIDDRLAEFLGSVLELERSIKNAAGQKRDRAENLLTSFLLSFASRAATRDRLNLFTTNYDRLIEFGCDLAGLRAIDRFVGALSPIFRTARLDIDIHYNPPGIRGEPRYVEGVLRLFKLHGSLDWRWKDRALYRVGLPFGCPTEHPGMPKSPSESVIIYPNAAKDVETLDFPFAELFRDFAAAACRPNSSLITYGYGFGDDHVNRILKDMLTIPSTHLVIISWDQTVPGEAENPANAVRKRIRQFCNEVGKSAQISLLLGSHFGDLETLVEHYLPKPAIDYITIRKTKLEEQRGEGYRSKEADPSNE